MSTWKSRLIAKTLTATLTLLWVTALAAQSGSGAITGTVKNATGVPLAEITVSLTGKGIGESAVRATNAEGWYRFSDLSAGEYDLEFRHPGYAAENRAALQVSAGKNIEVNAVLRQLERETVALTLESATASRITNQASVRTSTPEGRPGDESAAETTTVTSRADLAITMSDRADPVIAGETLTYVVTVTNAGPSTARYVEVTGTPPTGVTVTSTVGCLEGTLGVPVCSLGTIPAGGSKQYSLEMSVHAGTTGRIVNQASVTSQTMEVKPGDESAREETEVEARADLGIAVVDSVDPVIDGRPVIYTVTVSNRGPSDARGVVVTDELPPGLTFASTTGCGEDPAGAPRCSLGVIAAGSAKRYSLSVAVDPGTAGVLTHLASVTAETPEASPGDEATAEDTLVQMRSDLALTIRDSEDPVIAGTSLTYTVTVANQGPSAALGVVVENTLPPDVTLASTTGCAEDPAGVPSCSLGAIAAGTSKQVLIVTTVSPGSLGGIAHRASVKSSTQEDKPGNEVASEETQVDTRADLVLTHRDSQDPVIAGTPLTYTVTVRNQGPSDARDVATAGTLPEGVKFLSTAGCAEDESPGGGLPTCTLGTIPAGGTKQYTVAVAVDADATGVIVNRAAATSSTAEGKPGDEQTPRKKAPPSR